MSCHLLHNFVTEIQFSVANLYFNWLYTFNYCRAYFVSLSASKVTVPLRDETELVT